MTRFGRDSNHPSEPATCLSKPPRSESARRRSAPPSRLTRSAGAALACAICCAELLGASEPPVAVAPGESDRFSATAPCPTFHWGRAVPALSYRLVVARIVFDSPEADPVVEELVLDESIEGSAFSWSPSLSQCLPPGAFAWTIRAEGDADEAVSEWAAWKLFEVLSVPFAGSPEPVPLAILGGRDAHSVETLGGGPTGVADATTISGSAARLIPSETLLEPGLSLTVGPPPSVRVVGEVRKVDTAGLPRLWGEGRPGARIWGLAGTPFFCSGAGSVRYGLSEALTDWGSSPAACPAGTWVCSLADLGSDLDATCFSARPSHLVDEATCNGDPFQPSYTRGWLADAWRGDRVLFKAEFGSVIEAGQSYACRRMPVWCCF